MGAFAVRYLAPDVVAGEQADQRDAAEAIQGAKTEIQTRLPEADALTFGQIKVSWIGDDPVVCGYVEVKEDQDTFDGDERFVFANGDLTIEEIDGTDRLVEQWKTLCRSM